MQYKWSDILNIAIDLHDAYPEIDPQWISFPDLHSKICSLEKFDDNRINLIYSLDKGKKTNIVFKTTSFELSCSSIVSI